MTMWALVNKKSLGPHQIRQSLSGFFCFIHPLRFIPNTFLTILNASFLLIKRKDLLLTIKESKNRYFTIELILIDLWDFNFYLKLIYNNGDKEKHIQLYYEYREVKSIISNFRDTAFALKSNNYNSFEFEDEYQRDEYEIDLINEDPKSNFKNLVFRHNEYDDPEFIPFLNQRAKRVEEELLNIVVSKRDLLDAAYELEKELVEEITNISKLIV